MPPFTPPFPVKLDDTQSVTVTCNATSPERTFKSSLPASYFVDSTKVLVPDENLFDFYREDLDVGRLNLIHDWLWLAGTPEPARALHRQKMLKRDVVIVEQADLHLVWDGSCIFIKPLPQYLLFSKFWEDISKDEELRQAALGFLRSYSWLIRHESDFIIANELHLIPSELK